jgi:hypothetical protein
MKGSVRLLGSNLFIRLDSVHFWTFPLPHKVSLPELKIVVPQDDTSDIYDWLRTSYEGVSTIVLLKFIYMTGFCSPLNHSLPPRSIFAKSKILFPQDDNSKRKSLLTVRAVDMKGSVRLLGSNLFIQLDSVHFWTVPLPLKVSLPDLKIVVPQDVTSDIYDWLSTSYAGVSTIAGPQFIYTTGFGSLLNRSLTS